MVKYVRKYSSSFLSITMYIYYMCMSVGRISDPGIRHIIESPSGASLRELNLTNCYKISDVTLLRLSQRYVRTYIRTYIIMYIYVHSLHTIHNNVKCFMS